MKEKKTNSVEKINLTLPTKFFNQIKSKADMEYIKVTTWVRQYLMKNIGDDNNEAKNPNPNEN